MKIKQILLSLTLSLLVIFNASAWGSKGHDIIAYVAECNLTPEAKAEVDRLLKGYSMVYWSNWADSSRYTEEYSHTKGWHYRNVEEDQTPSSTPTAEGGDVVWAVDMLTKQLADSSLSSEEHAVALKFLVHFVGDLHCPMHAGRYSDLGGNKTPMKFFNQSTNLHSVWDSRLINYTHDWSYTEWQREIDRATPAQEAEIVKGSAADWFESSYEIAVMAYEDIEKDNDVSYDYIGKYQELLERQLRDGGLRLAHILNTLYK